MKPRRRLIIYLIYIVVQPVLLLQISSITHLSDTHGLPIWDYALGDFITQMGLFLAILPKHNYWRFMALIMSITLAIINVLVITELLSRVLEDYSYDLIYFYFYLLSLSAISIVETDIIIRFLKKKMS